VAEKAGEFNQSGHLFWIIHGVDFSSDQFESILERPAKVFFIPQRLHQSPPAMSWRPDAPEREPSFFVALEYFLIESAIFLEIHSPLFVHNVILSRVWQGFPRPTTPLHGPATYAFFTGDR